MKPVVPDYKKAAAVSSVIFLIFFSSILLIMGAKHSIMLASITKAGFIIASIGMFWFAYDRWLWRKRLFSGWFRKIPDLNGRWEGTVCRLKNGTPHFFALEVTQTFTTLTFKTFTDQSKGESIAAIFLQDEHGAVDEVLAYWRTTTRRLDDPSAEDTFEGISRWALSLQENQKRIEDYYFTRREPPTRGVCNLTWVCRERRNCVH